VACDVEPVGPDEVRVVEPELRRLPVHQLRERGDAAADVERERRRRVVRALDQRRLDEVLHGDALAGAEVDRRLADGRRALVDDDDVVGLRPFERDEDRHQLRDRRDRDAVVRPVREQHLAGRAVLDQPGARVDVGDGGGCGGGQGERREEEGDEAEPHVAEGYTGS
jgi:hypothetical protein